MYLICRNSRGNSTRHKMQPGKCWNGSSWWIKDKGKCFKSKYFSLLIENVGHSVLPGSQEPPPWAIPSRPVESLGPGSGVCSFRSEGLRKVLHFQTSVSLSRTWRGSKLPSPLKDWVEEEKAMVGIIILYKSKELSLSFFLFFFSLFFHWFHSFHKQSAFAWPETTQRRLVWMRWPHWESLKRTNEFSGRVWGLPQFWFYLIILLWLVSLYPCLSLKISSLFF